MQNLALHRNKDENLYGEGYILTEHARRRMDARGISKDALEASLLLGRVAHVRGAEVHVIGRREIARYANLDIDLSGYEGIHAVCTTTDRFILTIYRNRDLRGIRPPGGQQRRKRKGVGTNLLGKAW